MKNKKLMLVGVACLATILGACNVVSKPKESGSVASSATNSRSSGRRSNIEDKKYKVTYDLNYQGAPAATVVEFYEYDAIRSLENEPTRENYAFMGWFEDAACTKAYRFGAKPTKDVTVYAKWSDAGVKKFVAEAEYCPCITEANNGKGMIGSTYSGGTQGKGLIQEDSPDMYADASNGYWVHFLYQPRVANLVFEIKASKACKANIVWRISGEYLTPSFTVSSPDYKVKINDTAINYTPVTFENIPEQGKWLSFMDYDLAIQADLKEGVNKFEFFTDNDIFMKGTAFGLAPMIDCLKFYYTEGELTWPTAKPSQVITADE